MRDEAVRALQPRWRGRPGRLEVWYTTLTDPSSGSGVWLHHELIAPADGGPAFGHGWIAAFPPGGEPTLARFGPDRWTRPGGDAVFRTATTSVSPRRLHGRAGTMSWDLRVDYDTRPLYTFPRWAWEWELLPGAQIVPQPTARLRGSVRYEGTELVLDGVPGTTAHIYGHGNARRWAWLHADLGTAMFWSWWRPRRCGRAWSGCPHYRSCGCGWPAGTCRATRCWPPPCCGPASACPAGQCGAGSTIA